MRRVLVPLLAVVPGVLVAAPGAAAAVPTEVTCLLPTQSGPIPQFRTFDRPRSCIFVPRGESSRVEERRLRMRSIRWSRWGRPVASGSGVVVNSRGGSAERATIRLSSRISCGGKAFYTRGRLVYRDPAVQEELAPKQFKIQACAG